MRLLLMNVGHGPGGVAKAVTLAYVAIGTLAILTIAALGG